MAGALEIKISHDLGKITEFLDELKTKALVNAARMSMNKTVSALRTQANQKVREQRKLKASEINQDYFKVVRARGNDLGRMNASLNVSGRPVSMIRFVVGDKNPRIQAGIPVKKRKPVKVEIKPGVRTVLRKAFIAKGNGGAMQLFTRTGPGRGVLTKKAVSAISTLLAQDSMRAPLEAFAQQRLGVEFERAFKYEIERLQAKQAAKGV